MICYFNPRTREGCDSSKFIIWPPMICYFNPRTREGCDDQGHGYRELDYDISIHAPVKGATNGD